VHVGLVRLPLAMPVLHLTLESPSVGSFSVEIDDDETVEALAVVAQSLKDELGKDFCLVREGLVLSPEQELRAAGLETGAAIAIVSAAEEEAAAAAAVGAVQLTGFGPFAGHAVNASWETVRELSRGLGRSLEVGGQRYAVRLPASPLQVAYATVDALASAGHYGAAPSPQGGLGPELPIHFVMHVGVGREGPLRLESQARNFCYAMPDACGGWCGDAGACVQDGPPSLQTPLDLNKVCAQAQAIGCPAELEISSDAGLYLCEYVFYKSLHSALCSDGNGPVVLFVHVPPIGTPYSLQQLVASLRAVLKACLEQCAEIRSVPSASALVAASAVNGAAAAEAVTVCPPIEEALLSSVSGETVQFA